MKQFIYWAGAVVLLALFAGCAKHRGDVLPPLVPTATLSFSSPTAWAGFSPGDSVLLSGLAIAPAVMHGYDISVHKAGDTATNYFFVHIHDHNDTLVIWQKWKNTAPPATDLEAEVTLYLDHDGHTKTGKVGIRSL
jgi:hypothetical protein